MYEHDPAPVLKISVAQKTRIGKFLGKFFSENLSVRKFVLTCNTIHARKCKLKFVCRSPGGKTAPGFSLRGRGTPKTLVEALNTPVVAPVMCLFGGGGICFLSTRPNRWRRLPV